MFVEISSIPFPRYRIKKDADSTAKFGEKQMQTPDAAMTHRAMIMLVFKPILLLRAAVYEHAIRNPIELIANSRPS